MCIYEYTRVYMYVHVCMYMYAYTDTYVHACMSTDMYIYIHDVILAAATRGLDQKVTPVPEIRITIWHLNWEMKMF